MPKKTELAAWRRKHFTQLEKSIQVAIKIRDEPESGAKCRAEAIKIIGRLLGALQPEKTPESRSKDISFESVKPKISDSLREKLERLKKNGMDTPNTEVL